MKHFFLFVIKKYKQYISPIIEHRGVHCKFYPTCSDYAKQAIEKYGVAKGCFLGLKRFLRCNPFSKGGYDPVK